MWTFSTIGFFSAVEDRQQPGHILVRFRDPQHAERFLAVAYNGRSGRRVKIKTTPPPADYRWKVSITRERFAETLARIATEIDYSNFKGACHAQRPEPYQPGALSSVWTVMHRHQSDVVAGRRAEAEPDETDDTPYLFPDIYP